VLAYTLSCVCTSAFSAGIIEAVEAEDIMNKLRLTGCILGVGLVLSLMSHSGQTESRVHVAASLRKLSAYLDDSGSQSRTFQEVLAYTLSCVCTSAFSAGIIEAVEAEDIMNKLRLLVNNNQQVGISGRFPLMSLTDVLSVAVRHREKDTLAWMTLQSLYQARIVSHANTGSGLLAADIRSRSGCMGRPRCPSPPRPQCQLVAMASGTWPSWASIKLAWQESITQGHSAGGSHSPSQWHASSAAERAVEGTDPE
ncbi:hypothetical protein Celaphus_00018258, partial [Cervus elaphus hippelaphus]